MADQFANLSSRRQSAAPAAGGTQEKDGAHSPRGYLALTLRLRVVQIVCGISTMVMGSVALIEERRHFNLGLGVPAGAVSVLAAAVSIHSSRGWPGAALWACALVLLLGLAVQCCRTIVTPPHTHEEEAGLESLRPSARDLVVIAWVQAGLAAATLASAAACARIAHLT